MKHRLISSSSHDDDYLSASRCLSGEDCVEMRYWDWCSARDLGDCTTDGRDSYTHCITRVSRVLCSERRQARFRVFSPSICRVHNILNLICVLYLEL